MNATYDNAFHCLPTFSVIVIIFLKDQNIFQEEGWKLNRNHYYQEGWLSTANLRGVVGVTYTTSHCGSEGSTQLVPPLRTNYNLRGHRAEVSLFFYYYLLFDMDLAVKKGSICLKG